jgi:hypothetical protein
MVEYVDSVNIARYVNNVNIFHPFRWCLIMPPPTRRIAAVVSLGTSIGGSRLHAQTTPPAIPNWR